MGLLWGFLMAVMRMVGVGFPCRLVDGSVVVIVAQEVERSGEVMDEKEGGDQERTQNTLPWTRRAPTASEATFADPAQSLSKNCSGSELLGWWGRQTLPHVGLDTRPPPPRRLMGAGAHWAVDLCSHFQDGSPFNDMEILSQVH